MHPAFQRPLHSPSSLCPSSFSTYNARSRLPYRYAAGTQEFRGGEMLDQAANRFGKGVAQGMDPDELVANEFGKSRLRDLTKTQDQYKDKIREKLSERAAQLEEERAQKQRLFSLGKLAYERGNYAASLELLEKALDEEGPFSILGGEIQLWLALAYQAEGREQDCIDTYKRVEATHPNPKIRKQAGELRFIMEAPKLQVNPDERVQLPVLTNLEINRNAKPAVSSFRSMKKSKRKKSLEEQFMENYRPPDWATNRYVWVASLLTAAGLAYLSAYLRHWL